MRHKKREWEPSESHCPTPMASSSAYSCPLHGKGFSRTSNCPYPVLSEPILRHLISSSHPSTKSSVFSNFKTHLSMAILLPWGRKNVYIFLVVGRHSTEGSCHVQQFPTGSAGVVPLVQGSNGFCCFACPILPQLSFSACFHANQDWIHGTNYLKEFSFNYLRGKRKLLCTPVSRLHIHIQAIPPVLIQ